MSSSQNYIGAYVIGMLVIVGLIGFSVWWSVRLTAHMYLRKGKARVHAARAAAPSSHKREDLGWNAYFHKHNMLRDIVFILSKRRL